MQVDTSAAGRGDGCGGGGFTVIMTNINQKIIIVYLGANTVKNIMSYKISVKNSRSSKITKCRGTFHFSTS